MQFKGDVTAGKAILLTQTMQIIWLGICRFIDVIDSSWKNVT